VAVVIFQSLPAILMTATCKCDNDDVDTKSECPNKLPALSQNVE